MSERFQGNLRFEPVTMVSGKRWYRLLEPVSYTSHRLGNMTLTVPAGFLTDMASVPILLQPLIQKDDGALWPAVIHDWLYSNDCDLAISRKMADEVLLEAMTECGVGPVKRGLIYHAVRLGGGNSWRKR